MRLDALNRLEKGICLAEIFQRSRDHGLEPESLAILAKEWSERLGLTEAEVMTYLTEHIHYYLDQENHSGLQLFLRYAHELGLIAQVPDLRFLGATAFSSHKR